MQFIFIYNIFLCVNTERESVLYITLFFLKKKDSRSRLGVLERRALRFGALGLHRAFFGFRLHAPAPCRVRSTCIRDVLTGHESTHTLPQWLRLLSAPFLPLLLFQFLTPLWQGVPALPYFPGIENTMFQLPNGDRSSRGTKLPPHRTGHSSCESAHHRYNWVSLWLGRNPI